MDFKTLAQRWELIERRYSVRRRMAFFLAIAAVLSGIVTVVLWTGAANFGPDPNTVRYILYIDIIILVLLGGIVARQVARVWAQRKRGLAGSGLHTRLVVLFSLVAVTPAILVAVFSAVFLNFGIQAWFSERVRTAIEASSAVAQAYLREHRQSIRTEAFAMANALNREAGTLMRDPGAFDDVLGIQAQWRALSEALVVDGSGRVLARAPLSLTPELGLEAWETIAQTEVGQVAILLTDRDERVRAAVKLNRFIDAYLVIGRVLDPGVLAQIARTEIAVDQYQNIERNREGILITFVMIFVIVALLLLLAAAWIGLTLATQISGPITGLIAAAERVSEGDLSVRLGTTPVREFTMLTRAFNRMAGQIQTQQQGLLLANRDLDERRRFTEAVLGGVSVGVIGLDARARIDLPNRSAADLLSLDLPALKGVPLVEAVPEITDLMANASSHPERTWEAELRLMRGTRARTLVARVVAERLDNEITGYVVTLDDITALVQAERTAAWADVARRIAHEIKNPLTPIQLASERLRRKYSKEIKTDPHVFLACTETIIRQVEDIGRMVDEFSMFARMPRPELKPEDVCALVRQTIFLERNRAGGIRIETDVPKEPVVVLCDARQISQALINLIKNAVEAVNGRDPAAAGDDPGWIGVSVRSDASLAPFAVAVAVEDNGRGLPQADRERLTEPYVTTRAKGTGLGLSIVKKIMEDHHGDLVLEDREGGGARVSLLFGGANPGDASTKNDVKPEFEDLGSMRFGRKLLDG